MAGEIARGEIWMYPLPGPDKLRPVVVLTRDEAIPWLTRIMVAPITSQVRGLPSEVLVGEDEGLKRPSAISLDNVQTVLKSELKRFVGSLSRAQMDDVCRALEIAVGCRD